MRTLANAVTADPGMDVVSVGAAEQQSIMAESRVDPTALHDGRCIRQRGLH